MDIERTMQFILDQQAQFSSDIARIKLGTARSSRASEEVRTEVSWSGKKPCSAQEPLRNGRVRFLQRLQRVTSQSKSSQRI